MVEENIKDVLNDEAAGNGTRLGKQEEFISISESLRVRMKSVQTSRYVVPTYVIFNCLHRSFAVLERGVVAACSRASKTKSSNAMCISTYACLFA